ncbi:GNAT family N-acetyltransferase [Ferrimicrobium sp.]|nr:GNAT family N-acetyltransferase [Ferrimicrobium sp.]
MTTEVALLRTRADQYLDEAPRADSEAISVGALTLFVSRTPWAYYARPDRSGRAVRPRDLVRLRRACKNWRQPLQLEWICDLHPSLEAVVRKFGLIISEHPLLVMTQEMLEVQRRSVRTVVLDPEDLGLLKARAVAHVAFDQTVGTQAGVVQREARFAQLDADEIRHVFARARSGRTVTGIAVQEGSGAVAVGSYNRVGDTAEIVGVGTLPAYRRRGFGSAVVQLLCENAFANGIQLVLLTAEDEQVAQIYQRLGFRRIGTYMGAEEQGPKVDRGGRS